jgi:phage baseplate assembly protein V
MMGWLATVFGIGRLRLIDDSGPVQRAQVDQGAFVDGARRLTDNVPIIGAFGFASAAPLGAEVLVVRCGADRSQSVGIATNHQDSRPRNLQPGDAALYDVRGRTVRLDADGMTIDAKNGPVKIVNATTVTIKAATKVRIEAPILECTGDIVAQADGTQVSLQALHDAYNAHVHTGVQTGTAKTGPTDKKA